MLRSEFEVQIKSLAHYRDSFSNFISDSDIESCLNLALNYLRPYSQDYVELEAEYQRIITLPADCLNVVEVYQADVMGDSALSMNPFDIRTMNPKASSMGETYEQSQYEERKSFRQYGSKLYLYGYASRVTILYTKKYTLSNLEEIEDEEFIDYLIKYTAYQLKMKIGNYLALYRVEGSPIETNGDILISQAESALQELEERILMWSRTFVNPMR